jgi:geranylgeranyl diphosphate synthase type I
MPEVVDALCGFVLAGGKRLRPLFCGYGFVAAGGQGTPPALIDVSASLELLHAFALLHDDVMDGSATRRGSPSLHRQFMDQHAGGCYRGEPRRYGEATAVLVGDYGFALAQRLVSDAPGAVLRVWHELCAELVMGQYMDIAGAARGYVGPGRALAIARYKTGLYTVERPMQLGAVLAGYPAELAPSLFPFARPLGEAFQLRDDLLGVFGDERQSGKPSGDDLRQAKPSTLLALGQEMSTGKAAAALQRVGRADLTDADLCTIRAALMECGAREEVERLVRDRFLTALDALQSSAIDASVKPALRELASRALWRAA